MNSFVVSVVAAVVAVVENNGEDNSSTPILFRPILRLQ
jgi:hypothetical protein